ncbi:MAG: hypothetical protein H6839_15765 [Planctomycetes bacterium]|nr:hypothetical protein [Planctomycetota bacterium]MCB9895904.1 hypothetical protein [Planctomycetota bacterium]
MSESVKPIPYGGEDGLTPDLRVAAQGISLDPEPVGKETIRRMFGRACQFLDQVTRIVSGVLDTVSVGDIRSVCADEFPVSRGAIHNDGTRATRETSDVKRDHRTLPRSRAHPLLMLMKLGVQAARLLKQIGSGMHPHAANALEVGEKIKLQADRAHEKLQAMDRKHAAEFLGG